MSEVFVRRPAADYPDTASWMATLDHSHCRRKLINDDGTIARDSKCMGMHCTGCGQPTTGGAYVPCDCRDVTA